MLSLTKGTASEKIIVTLTELKTIATPYYLFIFTHVVTKRIVVKLFSPSDEESNSPGRYNKFSIATATLFDGEPVGEWHYEVREQASSTNLDPALSGSIVEQGKMILYGTEFEYEKYDQPVTYKTYNG